MIYSGAQNFLDVFAQATGFEHREGREYYTRQHARMVRRACETGIALPHVCGAFAALSPNNLERTNYIALDRCIAITSGDAPLDTPVPAYGRDKDRALAILAGGDPLAVLSGPKVRAFYACTLDPENAVTPVIDGHMHNVWSGAHGTRLNAVKFHAGQYAAVAGDMTRAAFMAGLPVSAFQAVVWIAYKRLRAIANDRQLPLEF